MNTTFQLLDKGEYKFRNRADALAKINKPSGLILEPYLYRALEDQGFRFDVEADNKSVFDPKDLMPQLRKYEGTNTFIPNWPILKKALKLAWRQFGYSDFFMQLETLPLDSSLLVAIKGEKSAGLPSLGKKIDSFPKDLSRARRWLRSECNAHPCLAYHRSQHGKAGPKTRLVWGYPLSITLAEAKFARPLIEHFMSFRSCYVIGCRKYELSSRLTSILNSNIRMSLDFSSFDSTVHPFLIDTAFDILSSWFSDCKEEFEIIKRYFIYTPILMPDGHVYVKTRGIPSGSYFTQMVGSIVNYIATQYTSICISGKPINDEKLLVMGDDSIFGVKNHFNPNSLSLYAKELGLIVNPDKIEMTRFGDAIHFLGHFWDGYSVDRDPKEIAIRLAFPERHCNDDIQTRVRMRLVAFALDSRSGWRVTSKIKDEWRAKWLLLDHKQRLPDEPLTGWMYHLSSSGHTWDTEGPYLAVFNSFNF